MIYRGQGFLAVVLFGSSPIPSPPSPVSSSTGDTQEDQERETTCLSESNSDSVGGGIRGNVRTKRGAV
jgi:hypothetical protein